MPRFNIALLHIFRRMVHKATPRTDIGIFSINVKIISHIKQVVPSQPLVALLS
jgi:hypothetical protein